MYGMWREGGGITHTQVNWKSNIWMTCGGRGVVWLMHKLIESQIYEWYLEGGGGMTHTQVNWKPNIWMAC